MPQAQHRLPPAVHETLTEACLGSRSSQEHRARGGRGIRSSQVERHRVRDDRTDGDRCSDAVGAGSFPLLLVPEQNHFETARTRISCRSASGISSR